MKIDRPWHYGEEGVNLVLVFEFLDWEFLVLVLFVCFYFREHFNPLLEQISKLEEALYNIQFEQHWLEAQTDRQALVNESMARRAMQKAFFESIALIGACSIQVYLLLQLFERKLGTSRV
ncbi:transmembrane emp24 domain-containing protein p24beta2-like [Olea europaea var. sylvestris]|uniref:transmembrane emp24 domain-containing protein p24beta2-like n=1 Tax=Olea europaea var. sylvestris TaxID=158386 RepID=UPI000C1D2C37|nr:transmembrane emp24 domain-containing protein p24beta2-like [Olea europaea var. sylvestris]